VTYANGDKEVLYFKVFDSEVMLPRLGAVPPSFQRIKRPPESRHEGAPDGHPRCGCADVSHHQRGLPWGKGGRETSTAEAVGHSADSVRVAGARVIGRPTMSMGCIQHLVKELPMATGDL
jgi:hypothetical protein